MKPAITPGPWTVNRINNTLVIGGKAFGIANVLSVAEVTKLKHHSEGNAHLIAAAPDLLEALQKVYAEMGKRISPAAFDEFSESCKQSIESALERAGANTVPGSSFRIFKPLPTAVKNRKTKSLPANPRSVLARA